MDFFNSEARDIANKLSLRLPQQEALNRLAIAIDGTTLQKDADTNAQLQQINYTLAKNQVKSSLKKFDRNFCSFTFDIATGVGKTRLMGAFVAYLYRKYGYKNFLIIAPSITIYNKLMQDFAGGSKYVFKGLEDIAMNPPAIISGDNYERSENLTKMAGDSFTVNVFNIDKLNEKQGKQHLDKDDPEYGKSKLHRQNEYLGDTFFNVLSQKEDLVVIMDEAHHYRDGAAMKTIEAIKPILGIELTATPKEKTNNILYHYQLPEAIKDKFVKRPVLIGRRNFNAANFDDDGLDHYDLQEAEIVHSIVKQELEVYAYNNQVRKVKPFVFVIASDIDHAKKLQQYLESDAFFEGKYKGKVLQIDSKSKTDDKIQALLNLENEYNQIEFVIHVSMLGEGWDVTNLYTIVPLRAANSKTLVMQSIGRGLRLPYGTVVGEAAVDNLNIIAHKNFETVLDDVNNELGKIEARYLDEEIPGLGENQPAEGLRKVPVKCTPKIVPGANAKPANIPATTPAGTDVSIPQSPTNATVPTTSATQPASNNGMATVAVVPPSSLPPTSPNVPIAKPVAQTQPDLFTPTPSIQIDIPKVYLVPTRKSVCRLETFLLNEEPFKQLNAVDNKIVVKDALTKREIAYLKGVNLSNDDYNENEFIKILNHSMQRESELAYSSNILVILDVIKQVNNCLKNKVAQPANVIRNNYRRIVDITKNQLLLHKKVNSATFEYKSVPGSLQLSEVMVMMSARDTIRCYTTKLQTGEKSQIKSMVFNGFTKCLYDNQKFDSNPELEFSRCLENDTSVKAWFRGSSSTFKIPCNFQDNYIPDFVVQTKDCSYVIEVKAKNKVNDPDVVNKAKAAQSWCTHASLLGKPWKYYLISEDDISGIENLSLSGVIAHAVHFSAGIAN